MDILPEDIELEDVEMEDLPTNTFLVDAESEQIAGMNNGIEAMRQAVEIMLTTKRFNHQIYTENFGIELDDLIGEDPDYIESVLPDRVREAFSIDERILGEQNFTFTTVGSSMLIIFEVVTVFGTFSTEVEI